MKITLCSDRFDERYGVYLENALIYQYDYDENTDSVLGVVLKILGYEVCGQEVDVEDDFPETL